MWLVTAVSKEQRAAIFDYFKNPSMEPGKSVKPAPGQMGPGGASTSPIDLGGGLDAPRTTQSPTPGIGMPQMAPTTARPAQTDAEKIVKEAAALEKAQAELDKKRMEALMEELKEAINKSQALEPFKDQLLLDITPEGLRIQIVDAQNRPMFDLGSSTAEELHRVDSTRAHALSEFRAQPHQPHRPYGHHAVCGHHRLHELGSFRRPRERRAPRTRGSGLATDRVSRVVGLSSSVLFDRENPRNPVNRRISIVVMTKSDGRRSAEDRCARDD